MQWMCQGSKGEYSNWKIHVYIQSYYRIYSAAAAAKSLQSCPTLCRPIDGSPPGSPVPGILQARTMEWVAISSFTDIERVLNITRIDCNKNKALFVHCKIPCSATDINWNRTFSERWETIFSLPPTTCVFFCFFFSCSWCNYDMWKCNIAKMVLAG